MNKILQIDYDEYQNLLNTLKAQEEIIKEFKKDKRVILVDDRYSSQTIYSFQTIPKIIGEESLIKEFLNAEYENCANLLAETTLNNHNLKSNLLHLKREIEEEKGFFKGLFN